MRDSIRGPLCLIGAMTVALSLLPAWAQERTVNFYNWSNYMAPGVLEDFTKETGIKVVYDTFDANETLETRLLAGKSGYDVVVPTGYFLQRQITAKVFLKLDKSKLPNLANAWPVVTGQLATYDPATITPPTICGAPRASATTSRPRKKFSAPTPRSIAGTSCSSRRISPNSKTAASTCWIPPTTSCPRR